MLIILIRPDDADERRCSVVRDERLEALERFVFGVVRDVLAPLLH